MKNLPQLILTFTCFCLNYPITTVASTHLYTPTENIPLDCGSSGKQPALDGRVWIGDDDDSGFSPTDPEGYTKSNISTASSQDSSIDTVPYMTARISRSQFTYSFRVTSGPKFVRLHFYTKRYPDFDVSKAFFTVKAGPFTLLNNFSAALAAEYLKESAFMKEFIVNVEENSQRLNLTFLPLKTATSSLNSSSDSLAFVNGIELVSMPTNLYYTPTGDQSPPIIGQGNAFNDYFEMALETVYRLNVAGSAIQPMQDTGMYREWSSNPKYLMSHGVVPSSPSKKLDYSKIPNYTAPDDVYRTAITMGNNETKNKLFNLTWRLPVDSGFFYLVRLHFCEFQESHTRPEDRIFQIFIDNQTANDAADIISWAGGNGIPVYKDFVVNILNEPYLFVALHPREGESSYVDAILNGMEVFKMSKNGNLAGPNPPPLISPGPEQAVLPNPTTASSKTKKTLFIALGSGVGFLIILGVAFWRLRKTKYFDSYNGKSAKSPTKASSLPDQRCRLFSLAEIKTATKYFDQELVIGRGGFGDVYQGYIDDQGSTVLVAIKRLNPGSNQGIREFVTEIRMLSRLRHVHLVSLIGYCDEGGEMILVYDYVANGTLRDHLYGSDNDPLTWKQRLEICIGAARGLQYLHAGVEDTVIHRDVKTTNILLDEKWVAKVSDFGLSKMGPNNVAVSTAVKGTFGYLDPEYARSQQLTDKSDVYSFGVVLFEVLCARKPLDKKLEEAQWNLAHWVRKCINDGTVHDIIDPFLMGKIAPECFQKFMEVAESCVRDQRIQRPTMGDVMEKLEFALELQEQADAAKEETNPDGVYSYPELSFHISDNFAPEYNDEPIMRSGTGLYSLGGSSTTGPSFLSVETDSATANMFSETTDSKSYA